MSDVCAAARAVGRARHYPVINRRASEYNLSRSRRHIIPVASERESYIVSSAAVCPRPLSRD